MNHTGIPAGHTPFSWGRPPATTRSAPSSDSRDIPASHTRFSWEGVRKEDNGGERPGVGGAGAPHDPGHPRHKLRGAFVFCGLCKRPDLVGPAIRRHLLDRYPEFDVVAHTYSDMSGGCTEPRARGGVKVAAAGAGGGNGDDSASNGADSGVSGSVASPEVVQRMLGPTARVVSTAQAAFDDGEAAWLCERIDSGRARRAPPVVTGMGGYAWLTEDGSLVHDHYRNGWTAVINMLRGANSLRLAFEHLRDVAADASGAAAAAPLPYDVIVFSRLDVLYVDDLNLSPELIARLSPSVGVYGSTPRPRRPLAAVVLTPSWQRHGGVNDRFAVAGPAAAAEYARRLDVYVDLLRRGVRSNSEALLARHLVKRARLNVSPTLSVRLLRVRSDGTSPPEDVRMLSHSEAEALFPS